MENKSEKWIICSALLMIILPWFGVSFISPESGMAFLICTFFAVNPIFFALLGLDVGKNLKKNWFLPLVSALLYVVGTWVFYDAWNMVFAVYALAYIVISAVAAGITVLKSKKNNPIGE